MATIDDDLIIYGNDLNIPPCKRNFSQYVLDKMVQNSDKIAQVSFTFCFYSYYFAELKTRHFLFRRKKKYLQVCSFM